MEIQQTDYRKTQQNKEEKKPLKAVGKGKVKKKSVFKKVFSVFVNEDVGSIKEYLVYDLLIPAIRDTIFNSITRSSEMLFYGKVRGNKPNGAPTYVSYNSYSNKPNNGSGKRVRSVYSFDDIVMENRGEAEEVLDILNEMIDKYGEATVADFYELAGVSGNGYTDRSFGWKDLHHAYVQRVRDGYLFNMPRCIELD